MSINALDYAASVASGKYLKTSSAVGNFNGITNAILNDGTYKTVLNLSGAGSIDYYTLEHPVAEAVSVRITIDGTQFILINGATVIANKKYTMVGSPIDFTDANISGAGIPSIVFKTSCLIEALAPANTTGHTYKYRIGTWERL